MIIHNLKIAFRNLWKHKFQNSIAIIGVAVGLSCFTLCCYVPRFFKNVNSTYPGSERIYSASIGGDLNGKIGPMLQNDYPSEIEKTAVIGPSISGNMIYDDGKNKFEFEMKLAEADTCVISLFSLQFLYGNAESTQKTSNCIILFEKYANIIGNASTLFGKEVVLGEKSYRITGIMKNLPVTSTFYIYEYQGFVFRDDGYVEKEKSKSLEESSLSSMVLLREGIDKDNFQRKIKPISYIGEECMIFLSKPDMLRQHALISIIIVFIGLLILLTGLLNCISFLTGQFYNRMGECAIRKVNGCNRRELFSLFFTELLIIWLIAGLLSFLMLDLFSSYFDLLKKSLYVIYDTGLLRIQLIEYLIWGILGVGLLSIIPTISIEKQSIRTALLGAVKKGNKSKVRNLVLFIQMAVFIGFFSMAILVKSQLNKSESKVFTTLTQQDKENILILKCDKDQLGGKRQILTEKIKTSPYVEQITSSGSDLYHSYSSKKLEINGEMLPEEKMPFQIKMLSSVSPDFWDFFKSKITIGNSLKSTSELNVAVVEEEFVSLFENKNPIGEKFTFAGQEYSIIGVTNSLHFTKDLKNKEFGTQKKVAFYSPQEDGWTRTNGEYAIYVKAKEGKLPEAKQYINQCIREFLPETIPFEIKSLTQTIKDQDFGDEMTLLKIGNLFGIIALIICLLSLYSSVTLNTEYRRKEVVVRKVNGAGVREIIYLFAKKYVFLLTGACLFVFPIVYFFGNLWLDKFVERISIGWSFFLIIYFVSFVLVLVTVIFKIVQVAKENPADVIKSE